MTMCDLIDAHTHTFARAYNHDRLYIYIYIYLTCNSNEREREREKDSRVLNEKLVVFGLDAAALVGHHGPVHRHQPLIPRLKPVAVPLRREFATCNTHTRRRISQGVGSFTFFSYRAGLDK